MTSLVSIYFRPSDGEIHSVTNGEAAPHLGLEVTRVSLPAGTGFGINPGLYRIDLNTGAIIEKTALERQIAARPTMDEIKTARLGALAASDAMMLPDRDLSNDDLAAWKAYRLALRNLTKDEGGAPRTAMEMFEAFPVAPDGTDPVWWLRKRMELA